MKKGLLIAVLTIGVLVLAALLLNLFNGGIWILEGLNGKNGSDGSDGSDGVDGLNGTNGKNAYELAVEDGFRGTLHEWLLSLAVAGEKGEAGTPGRTGADGKGVQDVKINLSGHLIVTLSDGKELDAGYVGGEGLKTGVTDDMGFTETYEILIQTKHDSMYLRQEPDTNSPSKGIISMGTEILRIGEKTDADPQKCWSRFLWNGTVCYARSICFQAKYSYRGEEPEIHLPDSMVLTAGVQAWFYTDGIAPTLAEPLQITYSYSGAGERVYQGNLAFAITPAATADKQTLTVRVTLNTGGEAKLISERVMTVTVANPTPASPLTGLLLGDSRISDGTVADLLGTSLTGVTFLGTCHTGSIATAHEGRANWSTSDYLNLQTGTYRTNAFYNPDEQTDDVTGIKHHFDFSYYMAQNLPTNPDYANLDFVVIQLGANDSCSPDAAKNIGVMVRSIQSWATANGKSVRIFVLHEYLSPADNYVLTQNQNIDIAVLRAHQFAFYDALEQQLGSIKNVFLLPLYLTLDNWNDRVLSTVGGKEAITDIIHLGKFGYRKEAEMIKAYLYGTTVR